MKKILCVLLSLIMSVSLIAIPLSAQAETKYWVDMSFAKNNIEGLRNYIKTNGKTNSDGDKPPQYVYINKYYYNQYIICWSVVIMKKIKLPIKNIQTNIILNALIQFKNDKLKQGIYI